MRATWSTLTSLTLLLGAGGMLASACGGSDDGNAFDSGGSGGDDAGADGSGATGGGGMGGAAGGANAECGNGVVEGNERCDDGNLTNGDGCEASCDFTCEDASDCDDGNPCNGDETCGSDNVCASGTPPSDGTDCGMGQVCVSGVCQSASCGDGQVQTSSNEECDDGDVDPDDGCNNSCKFSCLSTDSTRDCSLSDECAGTSTCDDNTHTCSTPTPLADDTPCDSGNGYCSSGVCTTANCGDQNVEPGEDCDDGNTDDDDGCTQNCDFTCTQASDCNDGNPCTQDVCDTTPHTCSNPADTSKNGDNCTVGGTSGTCDNGSCKPANCGDGTVDSPDEECDLGSAQNGQAGSGCTGGCQFECDTNNDCSDSNPCDGTLQCQSVSGGGGKACVNDGNTLSDGAVCQQSPRRICRSSNCQLSTCGDNYTDMGRGEECDPPNGSTCDSNCKTIVPNVCGDGNIADDEQCDDSNTDPHDGCDSNCQYELWMRMTAVEIRRGSAPSWCDTPANALGGALSSAAEGNINGSLADGIADGSTNILVQALDVDDLTGVSDPMIRLGISAGGADPARGTWMNDTLDWWFFADSSTLDSNGLPTGIMTPASVAARQLQAGPSDVALTLLLAGSPAQLNMLDAKVRGRMGTSTSLPTQLPSGGLASSITGVVEEMLADQSGEGLCGNITVDSLSKIPIPEDLTTGITSCVQCSNGTSSSYTYCGMGMPVGPSCNSLLDALVGGCKAIGCSGFGSITAISPTQPDVDKSSSFGTLSLGNNNKVPASQANGNTDAYSSYMRFTAKRGHVTGTQ